MFSMFHGYFMADNCSHFSVQDTFHTHGHHFTRHLIRQALLHGEDAHLVASNGEIRTMVVNGLAGCLEI